MLGRYSFVRFNQLAAIQYIGLSGYSEPCYRAVQWLVQYQERIEQALLLTFASQHALLLTLEQEETVAVKSGFASGYSGEGPRTLAEVLTLLDSLNIAIEEHEVSQATFERLEASAMTIKDIESIKSSRPVRPQRWHDYIYDAMGGKRRSPWSTFRPVMPWAIIDARLTDLALRFFDAPDSSILNACRRLEDHLRQRIGSTEHGTRLFAEAFNGT